MKIQISWENFIQKTSEFRHDQFMNEGLALKMALIIDKDGKGGFLNYDSKQ